MMWILNRIIIYLIRRSTAVLPYSAIGWLKVICVAFWKIFFFFEVSRRTFDAVGILITQNRFFHLLHNSCTNNFCISVILLQAKLIYRMRTTISSGSRKTARITQPWPPIKIQTFMWRKLPGEKLFAAHLIRSFEKHGFVSSHFRNQSVNLKMRTGGFDTVTRWEKLCLKLEIKKQTKMFRQF